MNESETLFEMMTMSQESLDPEEYEAFCKIHDILIDRRELDNIKLGY